MRKPVPTRTVRARLVLSIAVLVSLAPVPAMPEETPAGLPPAAAVEISFDRDVRPILQRYCFECHGDKRQQGGLRLDVERDAVRGGDSGVAFRAGKSSDSLLIAYVAGVDPQTVMPPKGEKLSAEQVGLLRAWIDQGAKWSRTAGAVHAAPTSDHWSFQPIRKPAVPRVQQELLSRNAIDRFILAKLEAEQIAPSPEADRRTLIRRLSFDLLGLPPSPTDAAAFADDQSPEAYAKLVDRLLASPHFGERWGRHWLDLARYADSDGYEKDLPRPHAWRYRQWVIDAINRDLPFDQFTIEQLAGDLLPHASLEHRIATGFHRNTLTNREGGVDKEEFRVAAVVDRVNTTGAVWLGLTLGCCQCHSHKYDPLAMHEYYGMFAFFNQADEVDVAAPLPHEVEAYVRAKAEFDAAHAPFVAAIANFRTARLPDRLAAWEASVDHSTLVGWTTLEPHNATATGGIKLIKQTDGSFVATGKEPQKSTYTLRTKTDLAGVTALRLETFSDEAASQKKSEKSADRDFVLSEFLVLLHRGGQQEPTPVRLVSAVADFAREEQPAAGAIDGNVETGWSIAPQVDANHAIIFLPAARVDGAGAELTIQLDQQQGKRRLLKRFRLSATTASRPAEGQGVPAALLPILATARADRTPAQHAQLLDWYAEIDRELSAVARAELEHARTAPPPPATFAQTLAETPQPRKTHLLVRGDFLRKGDEIEPHTPAVLPPLVSPADCTPNRLDLARWLVSRDNPLTARVAVNRLWKHLFGQALVATIEDFGTRGELPFHPELLDWLASEFMNPTETSSDNFLDSTCLECGEGNRGWSIKHIIRLIAMSATYRQSSRPRPELEERDPKNMLLSRQNRFRLEAEVIRDAYLAVSGLLSPKVGGPSVRPRQPGGIAELTFDDGASWVESPGEDQYRRGLYTWFQRTSPYPMLLMFDAPDSNVSCAKRDRSNTPLQALTLLNDPVFHECAQALSRRLRLGRTEGPAAQLQYGYELCVSRQPLQREFTRLMSLYEDLKHLAAADPTAACKLAGLPLPRDAEVADVAASVAMARILLNLDEFVTRE